MLAQLHRKMLSVLQEYYTSILNRLFLAREEKGFIFVTLLFCLFCYFVILLFCYFVILLFVICYLLFIICYLLFVICHLLFVICCLSFVVICYLLFVIYFTIYIYCTFLCKEILRSEINVRIERH
jgi:hypothetical protein